MMGKIKVGVKREIKQQGKIVYSKRQTMPHELIYLIFKKCTSDYCYKLFKAINFGRLSRNVILLLLYKHLGGFLQVFRFQWLQGLYYLVLNISDIKKTFWRIYAFLRSDNLKLSIWIKITNI